MRAQPQPHPHGAQPQLFGWNGFALTSIVLASNLTAASSVTCTSAAAVWGRGVSGGWL
jgi:hypothetical protein